MRALVLRLRNTPSPARAQRALSFELASHQIVEFVECGLCLPLGDADLVGQVSHHLRLRHPPPPKHLSPLNKMNAAGTKFKTGLAFQRLGRQAHVKSPNSRQGREALSAC